MSIWQSTPIQIDGILMDVRTTESGNVVVGKEVGEVYAADTSLTPDQARTLAVALIDGADHAEGQS
jgi:hypothetical protein